MYTFQFHRAASVADAAEAFATHADARYLAGGQTLLASLKMRLARPDALIDLGRVPELRGIRELDARRIVIGAMSTHADVEASALILRVVPTVSRLAGGIGDPMIRHQGTIGGSLANNDPAADWPAALLGLDGVVVTDRRRIDARDFLQGLFTTALEPDELILSVELVLPQRSAYVKFKHPASRFALVGVFVADFGGQIRVAVTGAAACAFRSDALEAALNSDFSLDSVSRIELDASDFNSDLQASAAYRAHLVRVMAGRAISEILGR